MCSTHRSRTCGVLGKDVDEARWCRWWSHGRGRGPASARNERRWILKFQWRRRRGGASRAERKLGLVKRNVTRRDHPPCRDVVAAVATMICGVADEDAWRRASLELVLCGCRDVGEATTPEHAQLVVRGGDAEEELVRRQGAGGSAGTAVDKVRRCGQCLGPKL